MYWLINDVYKQSLRVMFANFLFYCYFKSLLDIPIHYLYHVLIFLEVHCKTTKHAFINFHKKEKVMENYFVKITYPSCFFPFNSKVIKKTLSHIVTQLAAYVSQQRRLDSLSINRTLNGLSYCCTLIYK